MPGNPAIQFTVWHREGAVEARLHLQVKLHVQDATVGRVTGLTPILQGYVEISRAHQGGRSCWIADIAIGDTSRSAMIRAAVGVVVRHVTAITGATFAMVARDQVAEALGDTPLRLFTNAVEARAWVARTCSSNRVV